MHKLHRINKRKILYSTLFTSFMILSMISNVVLVNWGNNATIIKNTNLMGAAAVDSPWIVAGSNRTVRSYIQKDASALNQINEFNVTVPTSTTSKLNSANLNFTFAQDYNTNYTIEDDSTLDYPRTVISSRSNPYWSANPSVSPDAYAVEVGSINSGSFTDLVDSITGTFVDVASVTNEVNLTYNANFSRISGFDRTKAQSLRFSFYTDSTINLNVKIFAYNIVSTSWVQLNSSVWGTAKINRQLVTINPCLLYMNTNNITQVKIQLSAASSFSVKFYELRVDIFLGIEQDISKTKFAALEFDMKGNATIYGFYAWIRTMSSSITNANLTISLFRANVTAKRNDVISPTKIVMKPGTILLATTNITNYFGDGIQYFSFKSNNEGIFLNVSNYFIVISSNATTAKYSIVTIPYSDGDLIPTNDDPDDSIDHLFLKSENAGATWSKLFASGLSYQVDAAPFILNITRGWVPTDLSMSISNKVINSYTISTGIYATTSGYTWGLGQWNGVFVNKTEDIDDNVTIKVEYSVGLTSSLRFNVSYNLVVFSEEDAMCQFNASQIEDPKWTLNFTLTQARYTGWNLKNCTFVIPKNWDPTDLLTPNRISITSNTTYLSDSKANYFGIDYLKTIRYYGDGNYSLQGYSDSYIYSTSTALHYEDYKWPTHGFMQGDNISVSLTINNETDIDSYVINGDATCELYDISGSLIGAATLADSSIDSEKNELYYLSYTFDDENIIETTLSTVQGKYTLLYKWTNGLQIGYEQVNIYITQYSPEISNIFLDRNTKTNVIMGLMKKNATDMPNYNVTIYNINETTSSTFQPNTWHINNTVNQYYEDSMISLKSFMINESIFNIGEKIKLNVSLESFNDWWANDVKVGIQFTQFMNQQWIVMAQNSTEFELNKTGAPNDKRDVEFLFTIPSDFKGINAPLRQNSIQLMITLWINGVAQTVYKPIINATLINLPESSFDGQILGVKHVSGAAGPTFLSSTNRSQSILPGTTTYLIQVFDGYYVSTPTVIKQDFTSDLMSQLVDITSKSTITWGGTFNLTGKLEDEFGNGLSGKTIYIQYYDADEWHNMVAVGTLSNTLLTNIDGTFEGEFNSSDVLKSSKLMLNISWVGDSNTYSSYTTKSLSMITYLNQIKVSIVNYTDYPYILKGTLNQIVVRIDNIGNSSLYHLEFIAQMKGTDSITVTTLNPSSGFVLKPGQSKYLEFNFNVPISFKGDSVNIIVNTSAITLYSNEIFKFQESVEMITLDASFLDNLDQTVVTLTLLGIIALCVLSVLYAIRTNKKINVIPEPSVEKGRRGRYVDVKELAQKQKAETEKKDAKEKSKDKSENDVAKTTDLDDLLKEEGLDKDKSE